MKPRVPVKLGKQTARVKSADMATILVDDIRFTCTVNEHGTVKGLVQDVAPQFKMT